MVIGSISGFSVDEFVAVAAAMNEVDAIPAVELNVSCPNVKHGTEFGSEPAAARTHQPVRPVLEQDALLVKVSPTVMGYRGQRGESGVVAICRAAIESGAPAGAESADGRGRDGDCEHGCRRWRSTCTRAGDCRTSRAD